MRLSQILGERHAESNRDRMRQIFKDVPVIYGFSSKAPLGRAAGPVLEQYLQSGGAAEIASGQPSAHLLSLFAPVSMTVVAGLTDGDVQASHRRDVCQFADDRLAPEQKLASSIGCCSETRPKCGCSSTGWSNMRRRSTQRCGIRRLSRRLWTRSPPTARRETAIWRSCATPMSSPCRRG
jgi:hypothetical protein